MRRLDELLLCVPCVWTSCFQNAPKSAYIWMIDNQKNKRNANKMTLTYLIGKQYREQKKESNRPKFTKLLPADKTKKWWKFWI